MGLMYWEATADFTEGEPHSDTAVLGSATFSSLGWETDEDRTSAQALVGALSTKHSKSGLQFCTQRNDALLPCHSDKFLGAAYFL